MKCISLWQPWASAIALGLKSIETRHWSTRHRGPLAIHAARRWTVDEREDARMFARTYDAPELINPPLGAIIAVCRLDDMQPTEALVDIISDMERSFGNYGHGRFGWKLTDVVQLETPIPFRGLQGLFNVPDEILP